MGTKSATVYGGLKAACMSIADRFTLLLLTLIKPLIERVMARCIKYGELEVPQFQLQFPNGLSIKHNGEKRHRLYSSQPVQIQVHKPTMFIMRLLLDYKMGFCESYMYSEWDCSPSIQALISMLLKNEHVAYRTVNGDVNVFVRYVFFAAQKIGTAVNYAFHLLRANSLAGSASNIPVHYDVGNAFFELFLDEDMNYSCAYFNKPDESLKSAQNNKMDMVLDKLKVNKNDRILDIGCGWGALAVRAASQRHLNWTGVTISSEQLAFGVNRVNRMKLTDQVQLKLLDYRKVTGQYDGIVSLEMLEHVGHDYLPQYFNIVKDHLKLGGRAVIQVMTWPNATYDEYRKSSDFFKKHLAPGLNLPSISAVTAALPLGLDVQGLQSIGPHYAPTMEKWIVKLEAAKEKVLKMGYPEEFYRLWHFFFTSCVPMFAEHHVDVIQFVLVKTKE